MELRYDLDSIETLDAQGVRAALHGLRDALKVWEKVATSGAQYAAHRKASMALAVLSTTPGLGGSHD